MKKLIILMVFSVSLHNSAFALDCIPTPHRTTGTHYEPVTKQQVDISKGVIVSGKVLSASDCKPVSNAKVSHWQAGENGRYQDRLRAFLYTNAEGQFQFETEWPNLNPPHIHFIVDAEGFNTLETQWIGTRRQTEINFNIVLEEKTN
ncbi:MAG: hypothetical protein PVF28_05140 [Thioalkalispiraceae bacterium]|jgi:protocatechuate 3,4-dioxygenase beta subunit